jgi:hypothetical protein
VTLHIDLQDVQQWLEVSKHQVTAVDAAQEATAFDIVVGALSARYDVDVWVDATTTPRMVKTVVSMLIAGWTYNRSYAEQIASGIDSYGDRLVSSAMSLLGGLADGTTDIIGEDETDANISGPVFWPTDLATTIAEDEGDDADGAAPRKFSMGRTF